MPSHCCEWTHGDVGSVVARKAKEVAGPSQTADSGLDSSLLQTSGPSVSGNVKMQRQRPSEWQRMRFGSWCRLSIRKSPENDLCVVVRAASM